MALAIQRDPRSLEDEPYAWVLWVFLNLLLLERQDAAQRASEREELVYGIAHAYHSPGQLDRWRYDLRRNAGLLEQAESAVQRAKRFSERLLKAQGWSQLDNAHTGEDG